MLDRLTGLEVFAKVAATGSLSAAAPRHGPVADHGHQAHRRAGSAPRRQAVSPHHAAAVDHRGRAQLPRIVRARSWPSSKRPTARSPPIASSRAACFGSMRRCPSARGRSRRCLSEFARRHPLVTVELGLNDRLVDLAEEGWDLAIRIGSLSNSSLIARRIAPCRTVVCAAPSYLEGARHAAHGRRPGGA